jgi:hypothetical protein
MVMLPGNRLRKSSGKVIKFKSAKKRANWERVAQAYKHGWKPKGKKTKGSVTKSLLGAR